MRRLKSVVGAAVLAACAGCLNIADHADGSVKVYGGTRADAGCIGVAFAGGDGPEAEQARAYAIILLPITVVDLPFEVVADTITLPYDIFAAE